MQINRGADGNFVVVNDASLSALCRGRGRHSIVSAMKITLFSNWIRVKRHFLSIHRLHEEVSARQTYDVPDD